jgi:3-oxoacyl-[acyl-carrier protein] reductase
MRKQKWGRIIHMTSVSVKQPIPGLLLSNVLRPGIVALTKSLAQEVAKDNVLINAVCPGYFQTDRVNELLQKKAKKTKKSIAKLTADITGQIPMGRMGLPSELADLVTFLASERAAYITGSIIQADGGYVKGPY